MGYMDGLKVISASSVDVVWFECISGKKRISVNIFLSTYTISL